MASMREDPCKAHPHTSRKSGVKWFLRKPLLKILAAEETKGLCEALKGLRSSLCHLFFCIEFILYRISCLSIPKEHLAIILDLRISQTSRGYLLTQHLKSKPLRWGLSLYQSSNTLAPKNMYVSCLGTATFLLRHSKEGLVKESHVGTGS
uniref:Uncharacterized protein n=1 Tax=Sphaerodactylus townsendi TaxID=933632 RepID=A0ACB8FHV0_9SAUR